MCSRLGAAASATTATRAATAPITKNKVAFSLALFFVN